MVRLVGILWVCVLMISGCGLMPDRSGKPYSDELPSLGWYCMTEGKSQKRCQKRWLLNGRPVDDIVYDTMIIDVDDVLPKAAPPAKESRLDKPATDQAVTWSRQPVTAVKALGEEADLGVENLGPAPRKTKDTIDMWASNEASKKTSKSAVSKGKRSTEPQGYTVQLGAFSSFDKCKQFFGSQQFRGVPLYMRKIISDGSPWWIVAQGEFETFDEAQDAAELLAKIYHPVVPWPRSWATIKALQR